MPLNQDNSPPIWTGNAFTLNYKAFLQGKIPVYWIDGQYIDGENSYRFDDVMPPNMTLHIPKVVRLLYTYDEDTDLAEKWGHARSKDCIPGSGGGGTSPCDGVVILSLGDLNQRYAANIVGLTYYGQNTGLGEVYYLASGETTCSATLTIWDRFAVVQYSGAISGYTRPGPGWPYVYGSIGCCFPPPPSPPVKPEGCGDG